jgi:hypothetical protein
MEDAGISETNQCVRLLLAIPTTHSVMLVNQNDRGCCSASPIPRGRQSSRLRTKGICIHLFTFCLFKRDFAFPVAHRRFGHAGRRAVSCAYTASLPLQLISGDRPVQGGSPEHDDPFMAHYTPNPYAMAEPEQLSDQYQMMDQMQGMSVCALYPTKCAFLMRFYDADPLDEPV